MDDNKALVIAEWRSGWTLVLAASLGFSFFSIMLAASGLFMGPLADEFGWSRTLLSAGPSIATTMTAVLSPFFGILVDRYGPRRVVLPGLALTAASIAAFSLIDGSALQWIALWVAFGVVAVSIKSTAWTAAVLGVFNQSRGLALGLTLAGTAVAQIAIPPLADGLMSSFGWRHTYIWLAAGWGGITLLVCFLFFRDAQYHAAKRRAAAAPGAEPEAPAYLDGLTPKQALFDSALWRVGISNFVVMALTIGLIVHLFPILTEAGISRANAAWLSSLSGVAGIAGKLITGVLLDRFKPNWIGGITLGVSALAFLLLWQGIHSPVLIIIAMIVNGYAAGTKTQITGFLTASYGGMKNFGVIYGTMAALMALASGIGPLIAGIIYDLFDGYGMFLVIGAIGSALGGALMISLPAYPLWKKDPAPPETSL